MKVARNLSGSTPAEKISAVTRLVVYYSNASSRYYLHNIDAKSKKTREVSSKILCRDMQESVGDQDWKGTDGVCAGPHDYIRTYHTKVLS